MPQLLVTTKLHAPRTRPNLVARPRLRELFDRGDGRRLTLLSAPAGFGKTTLLAEWSSEHSEADAVAWVSLEASDNDPARFLAYLVGALQKLDAGLGAGVLAALNAPEPPLVEAVVGGLVNDLAALGRGVTLVLDDYHLIHTTSVHQIVSLLLERLPEQVHLVIASRTDPPLQLARLRARGQLTEIRAADLRFSPAEASAFLQRAMGLALSANEVAALEGITEGWVAALQFAALSMRGRENPSAFIELFSGSNRHILDFLAEEVLDRQPEDVRGFLLATSVLEGLTAPLCDAVTARSDGQELLERLERENLFVVALDDERRWYRYHHLFADFLRSRLRREGARRVADLHLRASGWYAEHEQIVEAIGHALAGPDHEQAARLIEGEVKQAWSRGEGPTVLGWLEALPADVKRRRPRLLLQHAQALALTGRPDDATPLVHEAERAAESAGTERPFLLGFASAVRAWVARLRGDAPEAVALARHALALLPAEATDLRTFAAVCLGDALRSTGDLAAAGEALAEAAAIGQAGGHVYGTLSALGLHAQVQAERGRLGEAEQAFRQALRFAAERGVEQLPTAGLLHIGLASIRYERGEIGEAERELKRGVELAERAREVTDLVWAHVASSRVKLAQGDGAGALGLARSAEQIARASGADLQIALAASWMVRLRIARGDLAAAAEVAQERAAHAGNATDVVQLVDKLTSARLLLAQGRPGEALALLGPLREAAASSGRTDDLIEILALQALALRARDDHEEALSTLAQALALAESEGYVRSFVDEGTAMGNLNNLYRKLGTSSRTRAVARARELGLI